jgi:hypothetical protein
MKKVYVDDTNVAVIICPKCGLEKKIDVRNFKDTHRRLKGKCRCGEIFRFTLEFRRHHRKMVRLPGEYVVQGKDEKGEIVIEDISVSGIRFSTLKPHYISRNDTVELKFALDDPTRTKISKLAKIKCIIDLNVGAEYLDLTSSEKDLGPYLQT